MQAGTWGSSSSITPSQKRNRDALVVMHEIIWNCQVEDQRRRTWFCITTSPIPKQRQAALRAGELSILGSIRAEIVIHKGCCWAYSCFRWEMGLDQTQKENIQLLLLNFLCSKYTVVHCPPAETLLAITKVLRTKLKNVVKPPREWKKNHPELHCFLIQAPCPLWGSPLGFFPKPYLDTQALCSH